MTDSDSKNQAYIGRLAAWICRRGLQTPVMVGLEAGRPIAFLGGQLLWVAKPVLSLFYSGNEVSRLAELLEEPAAVEALIATLEAQERT